MSILEKLIHKDNHLEATLISLKGSSNIQIYGAGVYAYVVYNYLQARGISVKGFCVDAEFLSGNSQNGLPLSGFEDALASNASFVCGMASYPSVVTRLKARGVHVHLIDVPDFLNIPHQFLDWDFLRENESNLDKSYELLEDKLSKETYIASLNSKLNGDPCFLEPVVRLDHLYFCDDLALSGDESFLDVGGFDGDSIRDFLKITKGKCKRIVSLEPFQQNLVKLQDAITKLVPERGKAIGKGAWNQRESLSFQVSKGLIDSRVSEGGKCTIEVDKIDDLISDSISIIKMDINGAEYQAVQGAAKTIMNNRPRLAVKMHVKEDFYRLPILLKKIAPDIRLYLRQRNSMSMMLVLYAVFPEMDKFTRN